MKSRLNRNGDLHIPKIMRESIGVGLNEEVDITFEKNKIIVSNPNEVSKLDELEDLVFISQEILPERFINNFLEILKK